VLLLRLACFFLLYNNSSSADFSAKARSSVPIAETDSKTNNTNVLLRRTIALFFLGIPNLAVRGRFSGEFSTAFLVFYAEIQ